MGFLDRIASLVRRADSGAADLKGPLGLLPGDEISYYQERFRVVGMRTLLLQDGRVHHYRLRTSDGAAAVLSARSADADTWMIERVVSDLDVDWKANRQTGPEGDAFKLADHGTCAIRQIADAGFEGAQRVSYRRFADEDEEQLIVLEDYGMGREARVADPVFEGQLRFESDVTAATDRPWAVADDEDDRAAVVADSAVVERGSTVAAALALEGRFVSDEHPSDAAPDADPFEYADEEWADARDAVPEPAALPGSADCPNDPRAEWLAPTRWVAGSGEHPDEVEDDWLVRTA